jgi:hypothetical protein
MAGEALQEALRPLFGRLDVSTPEVMEAVVGAFNRETAAHLDLNQLSNDDRASLPRVRTRR